MGGLNAARANDVTWKSIVDHEGGHVFTANLCTYNQEHVDYPGHDTFVKLRMNTIRATFINKYVMELVDYFLPFQNVVPEVPSTGVEVPSQPSKIVLDLKVDAPCIIVPVAEDIEDYLQFALGSIFVNTKTGDAQHFTVGVRNTSLLSTVEGEHYSVIKESDIDVNITIPHSNDLVDINLDVPAFNLDFDTAVISQAMDILNKNVLVGYESEKKEIIEYEYEKDTKDATAENTPIAEEAIRIKLAANLSKFNITLLHLTTKKYT